TQIGIWTVRVNHLLKIESAGFRSWRIESGIRRPSENRRDYLPSELLQCFARKIMRSNHLVNIALRCLSLPRSEDGMPRALRLAAAANILLTEFKVADRIKDGGLVRWRLVQRFFSGGFRRAEALLRRLDFPVDELRRLEDRQDEREANPISLRLN